MMKIHYIDGQYELPYPVGTHMQQAIAFIQNVMTVIKSIGNFPKSNIAIWCRGSSGAILAGLLSSEFYKLGMSEILVHHVKKDGEDSHNSNGSFYTQRHNIIIDDFIASGETVNQIAYIMGMNSVKTIDYLIVSGIAMHTNEATCALELPHPVPKCIITRESSFYREREDRLKKLIPTNLKKL